MTQANGDTAEAFARALGVTIIEVDGGADGMCGECMVWSRSSRTVTVCRDLPVEDRASGWETVLARLDCRG